MRSGLVPCAFESAQLSTFVGQIADTHLESIAGELQAYDCRNNRIVQAALRQDQFEMAVRNAVIRYGGHRIAVALGTSTSGILQTEQAYRQRLNGELPSTYRYATTHNTFSLARFTQQFLGLTGPAVVVSTACSSSAKVFASASRMISAGLCDAAVVGGSDSLCLTTLYGFNSLQLLSSSKCRPYDADRDGISIGEGGGFALLERDDGTSHSKLALLGIGESSDAYHMSSPHPEGLGARLAMEAALRSANLQPEDIDYINLHGTGTRANDSSEGKAVASLFGHRTAVSSTKGFFGHTLGACGIQEAIVCLLALEHGFVPGSVNTRTLDPQINIDYAIENRTRAPRRAMSNSFGFGGTNCTLIFERFE
jgi:3-oxoacyl-[acyl-carrier-protein] synthase-1